MSRIPRKLPNVSNPHTDKLLRNARFEAGLTRTAASERAGLSEASLAKYEAGATWPHYFVDIRTVCEAIRGNIRPLPKRPPGRPTGYRKPQDARRARVEAEIAAELAAIKGHRARIRTLREVLEYL